MFILSLNVGVGLVLIVDVFNYFIGNYYVNVGDGDVVVRLEIGGEVLCVKVMNE